MSRIRVKHVATSLIAVVGLSLSAAAQGAIIAEWDFLSNEDLTFAANGASTNATLLNGATVNTGAAVPGTLTSNPQLLNGFLNTTGSTQGNVTDATWNQLYNTSDLTSGSFIAVFNANMANNFIRYTLLSHKTTSGSNGEVWAHIERGNGANSYEVRMRVGQAAADAAFLGYTLNNNDWYFWAASWTPGGQTFLYLRDITSGAPADTVLGSANVIANSGTWNAPLYLALRNNQTESARSPIAFAQLTDQYLNTAAAWDTIYSQIVPEPSSAVLILIGVSALLRRRRK